MSNPPEDQFDDALNALEEVVSGGKLEWAEYRRGLRIFDNLRDIQDFALVLDLAPVPELASREVTSILATGMYGVVLKAIEEAGFYQQDSLSLQSDTASAAIIYGDDRYDFSVQVTYSPEGSRQGQLLIRRAGSLLEDFHQWYTAVAPHFADIVKGILAQLRDLTRREIRAYRGSFRFGFLIHTLRMGDDQRPAKNSEVMMRLVQGVPGDDGALMESDEAFANAGRIDVNLSRWVKPHSHWRLERYVVEAPGNKEGAGLWLAFSYAGETYTLTTSRESFELEPFLNDGGRAYVDFLRDKALGRFLSSLLNEVSFRSATANLP